MRILLLAAMTVAAVFSAPVAAAQPGAPCSGEISFFCQMIPTAPDLEGTVDLTTQLPPVDPNAPVPESLPPLNPCINGCI